MIEHQVARRYARALFEATRENQIIDQVSDELNSIRNTIAIDESLINFLDAPQIKDEDKFQLIADVFKTNYSQLVYSLIRLTVEKRRSQHILAIIDEFTHLVEEEKGIVRVKITTAVPMELDLRDKLVSKLENMMNKKVIIFPEVDKGVIGGVIINMENMVIDNSIRFKLNSVRNKLLALRVH